MSKSHEQRKALGKGLSALLPSRQIHKPVEAPPPLPEPVAPQTGVMEIPIGQIEPNPLQPRSIFQPEKLAELAHRSAPTELSSPSLSSVMAINSSWWPANAAGGRQNGSARHGPVVVREFAGERLLELALIENIQREDLNPIEVAQALERLGQELSLSHEQIGERTGKDRTTVSNLIRLLRLPQEIQLLVAEGKLSMGHARAILGLPSEELMKEVAAKAAAQSLSVRQVEKLIQSLLITKTIQETEPAEADPNVMAATRELESALGTKVRIITDSANKGRIEIQYYSVDDLTEFIRLL
jgi:ParB-like partition proteins